MKGARGHASNTLLGLNAVQCRDQCRIAVAQSELLLTQNVGAPSFLGGFQVRGIESMKILA